MARASRLVALLQSLGDKRDTNPGAPLADRFSCPSYNMAAFQATPTGVKAD